MSEQERARVEATHKGRNVLIGSVSLRLSTGSFTRRRVQRLHLLETYDADQAVD